MAGLVLLIGENMHLIQCKTGIRLDKNRTIIMNSYTFNTNEVSFPLIDRPCVEIKVGDNVDHVVITPVNNEEAFLPDLVESMLSQSVPPTKWVIVDDKSTDSSSRIGIEASKTHPWIEYIRVEIEGGRRRGSRIAKLFKTGIERCGNEWRYCSKIDADMKLPDDYFERVFFKFHDDEKLGIASGNCRVSTFFGKKIESVAESHTRGGLKTYNRLCYDEIGGIYPQNGWDGIDNVSARYNGWKTENFKDIIADHGRRTGAHKGRLGSSFEAGKFSYQMGYYWPFFIGKCIHQMKDFPFFIGGLTMFLGYMWSKLGREKMTSNEEIRNYLKREQKEKLRSFIWPLRI
tara:strand:- start:3380 stop:4414 length:1035 start_codon:yes stop_codon:yes gene_type:complete